MRCLKKPAGAPFDLLVTENLSLNTAYAPARHGERRSSHYVTVGHAAPWFLCIHGWPQNHREFFPAGDRGVQRPITFLLICVAMRISDKPFDGYEPKTIATDML